MNFCFSPYQIIDFPNLVFEKSGEKTSLPAFAEQVGSKYADVPKLYFFLHYAAGLSATLVLNQIVQGKKKNGWVFSKCEGKK